MDGADRRQRILDKPIGDNMKKMKGKGKGGKGKKC